MTKRMEPPKSGQENRDIIDSYDYLGGSASATDCTGLIPAGHANKAERDSYESLCHFLPKAAPKKEDAQ